MSVTTSPANVEPPPLLFGQRSPSPPSFTSPPRSPNHLHHPQSPLAAPPMNAEDVDMSTSTTLLPPPQGQGHAREDSEMDGMDGLTNGHVERTSNGVPPPTDDIEQVAGGEEEDAMDTTPDGSQLDADAEITTENGRAVSVDSIPTRPLSGRASLEPGTPPPPNTAPAQHSDHITFNRNVVTPAGNTVPPPPAVHAPPPVGMPPSSPPHGGQNNVNRQSEDDSSSDDEDSGVRRWHPIQEDTSSPDERELKEIEQYGNESSALDYAHWEQKIFVPLDDPEYHIGPNGRIEWTVNNYNGTKEKPNKEILMRSPTVNVGDYDWQIKFYPRGNDSDYLSVYVECLTVLPADRKGNIPPEARGDPQNSDDASPDAEGQANSAIKYQETPLPLLDSEPIRKRRSVAAEVAVVLYNPSEPRVNYHKSCLHRFCERSPDWGWTRFHGPYYEIQHRHRGQRQALLRNDTLAFTAYIRIIEDETNCLWEHSSRENPWDSVAMTGLQGLTTVESQTGGSGGNLISAIATWMHLKPFRHLLYNVELPDISKAHFPRPKPLLSALQKLLYLMRTQIQPGAGAIGLEDITDALDWYGIDDDFDKMDVIEIWEVLRTKMEEELKNTPFHAALVDLFGVSRDLMTGIPSYRAPVKGLSNINEALAKADKLLRPDQALPKVLQVELERQEFNEATRTWKKLNNKVKLEDHITVRNVAYTLFGFIAHDENLQSGFYKPNLRPGGPGSKWYTYMDNRSENKVVCQTRRQIRYMHDPSENGHDSNAVAYIATYVRDDIRSDVFNSQSEPQWHVPQRLIKEVELEKKALMPAILDGSMQAGNETEEAVEQNELDDKTYNVLVISSRAFMQHEGPGLIDISPKWSQNTSQLVFTVQLQASDLYTEIRRKLAAAVKDVKDPRQCRFWFLDTLRGMEFRPNLLSTTGNNEFRNGSVDDIGTNQRLGDILEEHPEYHIWLHVVDMADLPQSPKERESPKSPVQESTIHPDLVSAAAPPSLPTEPAATQEIVNTQDTPMSEADEEVTADTIFEVIEDGQLYDSVPPPPPPVEVILPVPPPPIDIEMSGITEQAGLLPPPPVNIAGLAPPPPPPLVAPPPPDNIYFFLKYFDADAQKLECRGSYMADRSARVDSTILKLLDLPQDTPLELCEEDEIIQTEPIRPRRSFSSNHLRDACIIIASRTLTPSQCEALAARAASADPASYLRARAYIRNFPHCANGHFTLSYFSAEHYSGDLVAGQRHGQGTMIHFSGDVYTGSFRLGQRHGHGLCIFQNGDSYDGEWVAGQQHGNGTFIEASTGNTYVGGWKNDKRFGEGVTHWKVAQETERLCRICWEESAEAAFYDCGHVVACLGCARRVDTCPVCRKRVLSAMKLFYVS